MEAELEVLLTHDSVGWGPAAKDFAAGAIGGMTGVIAGQPLDTLRIRLQQRGCEARSVGGAWRAMAGAGEGLRGLFRGMSYPLYTTSLQNAVTFQAQRAGERALAAAGVQGGTASTCAAGMFAGAVQTFISSPVELLKIRLQLQRTRPGAAGYVGPWGMLRRVVREEGPRGLFRGCSVTMLRDTPSYGLYFVLYSVACSKLDALQQRLMGVAAPLTAAVSWSDAGASTGVTPGVAGGWDGSSSNSSASGSTTTSSSMAVQLLAGGLAGMLAWLSVYPLDVVKSRLQAHPSGASPYASAWHCALQSSREEGLGVFTRGLGATLGRAFLVNAVIFASFEASITAMGAGGGAGTGAAT